MGSLYLMGTGDKRESMGINVRQINVGKRWAAWCDITQSIASPSGAKVIILQEPTTGSLPNGIIFKHQSNNRCRASIFVDRQFADYAKCHLLTSFSNEDQAAISLQIDGYCGNKIDVILCSIYFPCNVNKEKMITNQLNALVNHCRLSSVELIIGCDANAHNTIWGCDHTDGRGEILADFCLTNELILLNQGNDPAFLPSGSKGRSSIIENWAVSIEDSKSDHRYIDFEISAQNPPIKFYRNKRSTDWNKFREGLKDLESNVNYESELNVVNLEEAAIKLNNILLTSYEGACKLKKKIVLCKQSWYAGELHDRRIALKKEFKRAYESGSQKKWNDYKEHRDQYHAKCAKAKKRDWRHKMEKIDNIKDVSRLQKFFENGRTREISSLRKKDGTYTRNIDETLSVLHIRNTFP